MTKPTTTISSGSITISSKTPSKDLDGPKYNTGLAVKTEVRYVLNWTDWSVDDKINKEVTLRKIEDLARNTVPGMINMVMEQKTQYFVSLEEAVKFKRNLEKGTAYHSCLSKEVVTELELSDEELKIAMEIK